MSRPSDWTAIPGTPSDIVREYKSLNKGRLATTGLTQVEIAILEGDFYRAFRVVTVPPTSSYYLKFTAPDDARRFGLVLREITPALSGIWYRVYRNAVVTTIPASEWEIFNENGYSPNVSGSTFQDVDVVTDIGDLSDIAWIPQGATNKTQGSLVRQEGFKLIQFDTELLIEIENTENQSNEVLIYYQWIEAPADVAGV